MIEAVLFGLLLLTGKWVTACLLLGVCAWDLRTYLRGEHKVRRRRVAGQSVGASAAWLGLLSSLFAGQAVRQRRSAPAARASGYGVP